MRNGNRPKRDKKTPKQSKPLKRKIHLGGGVWTYDINSNGLRIRTPCGDDTYHISHSEFVGWCPDEDSKAEILPSDVVGYIRREFLKTDPDWKYQYYHQHLRFAQKHGIDLLTTTTRKLMALIVKQEEADKREQKKRARYQAHLVLENVDLLLQLTDHRALGCSDDKPLERGMIPHLGGASGRRVECTRCYLLHIKEKGKWDHNFKLHLVALRL